MVVVSDTSPLSNLAIIGRLELLREQFGEVLMPPAVVGELTALNSASARTVLSEAIQSCWLRQMPLASTAPFPEELRGLDAGETEALRLALTISANAVLMDEKEGRQCAASLGIRTIGALGVLISAKQSGSVSSLRREIERLRRDAGFFVDEALETRVLVMVGE
jgi:hypothetical protein